MRLWQSDWYWYGVETALYSYTRFCIISTVSSVPLRLFVFWVFHSKCFIQNSSFVRSSRRAFCSFRYLYLHVLFWVFFVINDMIVGLRVLSGILVMITFSNDFLHLKGNIRTTLFLLDIFRSHRLRTDIWVWWIWHALALYACLDIQIHFIISRLVRRDNIFFQHIWI